MRNLLRNLLLAYVMPLVVAASTAPSPRIIVHLLDYVATDYRGAVQDGKIISTFEYKEQLEFAKLLEQSA